jgi:YfiH family protein
MTDFIVPDWPAPARVRAIVTTRHGGVSTGPYASLNLGDHVGDDPARVAENRQRLRVHLPAEPVWLQQVHGTVCVDATRAPAGTVADAAHAHAPGVVCAVLTADCLPVLLCDTAGTAVAVAHAGWRGLAACVIESAVAALNVPPEQVMAWLGPAIGADRFEVGGEVPEGFIDHDPAAAAAFRPCANGKWLCDLAGLARQRLAACGIRRVTDSGFCTMGDAEQFFSYRRDGETGRMASLIWLE